MKKCKKIEDGGYMIAPDTLKRIKKSKRKMKMQSKFILPHPNMIEMDEIKKSLSRKEPLLFLEYNKMIYVYVHKSIMWKADILSIPNTLPHSFDTSLMPLKNKWVTWVKSVKSAKWGELKQETEVKMIFPKI